MAPIKSRYYSKMRKTQATFRAPEKTQPRIFPPNMSWTAQPHRREGNRLQKLADQLDGWAGWWERWGVRNIRTQHTNEKKRQPPQSSVSFFDATSCLNTGPKRQQISSFFTLTVVKVSNILLFLRQTVRRMEAADISKHKRPPPSASTRANQ